ncbi:hypothetical protein HKX48_003639 [Thoreauomyces humboldtii]|nr:hypothetical protein HKX48_003639 [Thoreauomyces humboldtii]
MSKTRIRNFFSTTKHQHHIDQLTLPHHLQRRFLPLLRMSQSGASSYSRESASVSPPPETRKRRKLAANDDVSAAYGDDGIWKGGEATMDYQEDYPPRSTRAQVSEASTPSRGAPSSSAVNAMRVASLVHGVEDGAPSPSDDRASRPSPPSGPVATTDPTIAIPGVVHLLPFERRVESDPDGKPFHCTVDRCDKKYKKLNGLIYHYQTAHSTTGLDDPKPFKCSIPDCGKSYRNSNGLAYHIEKGHSAAAPAPIAIAPVRVPAVTRRQPVGNELVEKPYVCPHHGCDKAYKNPNGLAYHLSKGKATGHSVDVVVPPPVPKAYKCLGEHNLGASTPVMSRLTDPVC